jgi:hypothetical protein
MHSEFTILTLEPGFDVALSRWRVLTAYLLPNPNDDTAYITRRDSAISEVVQSLSHAFAPWANPKYPEQERIRSLTAILQSAADFGIFILSQPSRLEFRWEDPMNGGSRAIVVAPAVVKVTDERGQRLRVAQTVAQAVTQQI